MRRGGRPQGHQKTAAPRTPPGAWGAVGQPLRVCGSAARPGAGEAPPGAPSDARVHGGDGDHPSTTVQRRLPPTYTLPVDPDDTHRASADPDPRERSLRIGDGDPLRAETLPVIPRGRVAPEPEFSSRRQAAARGAPDGHIHEAVARRSARHHVVSRTEWHKGTVCNYPVT